MNNKQVLSRMAGAFLNYSSLSHLKKGIRSVYYGISVYPSSEFYVCWNSMPTAKLVFVRQRSHKYF